MGTLLAMRTGRYVWTGLLVLACDAGQSTQGSSPRAVAPDASALPMATGGSKNDAARQSSSFLLGMLRYRPLEQRASLPLSQRTATKRIASWAAAHRDASLDEMIRFALDFTRDALTFVLEKAERTPDGVLRRAQANCVGYAALFNAVLTELFRQRGLSSRYRTEHWVAKISFAGKSLHTLIESPFFRDHDYNRVRDLKSGRTLSVDPSLYEYAGIVYVRGE